MEPNRPCILCLIGSQGSGKNTIGNILSDTYNCPKLMRYTTRKATYNSEDRLTYYFVDRYAFIGVRPIHFIECSIYDGDCYGISERELYRTLQLHLWCHVPISYNGYLELKQALQSLDIAMISIFIDTPKELCIQEMKYRNDDKDKIMDRLKYYDWLQEHDIKNKCDYVLSPNTVTGPTFHRYVSNLMQQINN